MRPYASICAVLMLAALRVAPGATSAELWAEYSRDPDRHPVIPNCSYAGYQRGEKPLPEPAVVASVADCGAVADGVSDCTAAFAAAIARAAQAGGGAVLVPEGTYRLDGMIRLQADGVVLRGAGPDKTRLVFHRPLRDVVGSMSSGGRSQWSWSGGLVWMGPADTWNADGTLAGNTGIEQWETWRPGERIGGVVKPAQRGDRQVEVDSATAAKLTAGQLTLMTWKHPADRSLLLHMAGHPRMAEFNWNGATGMTSKSQWTWPVEIAAVKGTTVTLAQPLRVDIRAEWEVSFVSVPAVLREAGIEKLSISFVGRRPVPHLADPGFNGVYLNRCVHCFVRDVTISDCDNGLIHAAAKNTTVTGLRLTGGQHHHATALRVQSHDNLITDFRIESRPQHGINTENLSTGNVWRRGVMEHGTFDSHRGMSFDLLRTDITLTNDGSPGGAVTAGPFLGARCVHWNIRNSGRGEFVNQPSAISMGALVGVQGAREDKADAYAMPPGDKGCVIADEGRVPEIADLYEAQLTLRLGGTGRVNRPLASTAPTSSAKPLPAIDPAEQKRWNDRLAVRVSEAIASGQRPRFPTRIANGGEAEVLAIDSKGVAQLKTRSGRIALALVQLPVGERAALAVAVARADQPGDQALAAFHLLLAGKTKDAEARLANAGEAGQRVRDLIASP